MKILCWKSMRFFGANKIVQRTYIFLVIVPFLISTLNKYGLKEVINSIPFSWHMFFYSAVFFTIGNFIYQLYAPKIIKQNNSFKDFREYGKNQKHITEYFDVFNIPFEDIYKELIDNSVKSIHDKLKFESIIKNKNENEKNNYKLVFNCLRNHMKNSGSNFSEMIKINEFNLNASFWEIYSFANESRKCSLILCFIFFAIGLFLSTIVLINSIYVVCISDGFELFKTIEIIKDFN